MISSLKKVCNFLGHSANNLNGLIKKSEALDELNSIIAEHLDPELAQHCHVSNLQKGSITMSCDSAEWLTLMRFEVPTLLQKLRKVEALRSIANIRCQVLKPKAVQKKRPYRKAKLSSNSAEHLRSFANETTDERLKKIFSRIAERTLKKP